MSAKMSYVIRLSEDLYLDSNNNFLTRALPNSPVYALAGGDLPLSNDTRKTLLRHFAIDPGLSIVMALHPSP